MAPMFAFFIFFVNPHQGIFFTLSFREWKGGREGAASMWDTSVGCLSHTPRPGPGIKPTTQECALDRESNPQSFSEQAYVLTT